MRSILRFGLLATLLLSVAGCYGSTTSSFEGTLEPVIGTVLVDGQPQAGVQLFFVPTGSTPGTGAQGLTDASGRFELSHRSGRSGVESGEYHVMFSRLAKADGSPLGPEDDIAISGVEFLLAVYQHPEQTPVTATVPAGGDEFSFEIKAKK